MKRIGQVSAELDISPQTVRRWTERFAPFLSEEAGRAHRYTEEDVALLRRIRALHARGMEEAEIERRLREQEEEGAHSALPAPTGDDMAALAESNGATEVIVHLMRRLDEAQQTILSNQLATRDLLGLIVQDNFHLKEENARLRKRLRALEREVARLKEEDWNHRLVLEEQLNALRREIERRQPWWKRLFGR